MKEIYAIIRINKMNDTKVALEEIGHPAMTAYTYRVMGRGKQRGVLQEVKFPQISKEKAEELLKEGEAMSYVPKRLLYLAVNDDEVDKVVDTLIKVNQTGHHGDGKIFVCPLERSIRIRTGEEGE